MDLESGLLLFLIGGPFSVLVLWGLINFIGATESKNNEDEDSNDINRFIL